MLIKILIFTLLFLIVLSMVLGGFFLVNDKGQSKKMVSILTVRISLSVALFLLLLLAGYVGWIQPAGGLN
jgi:hypothetical protein